MNNRAFKYWFCKSFAGIEDIGVAVLHLLYDNNKMAFEAMEEFDCPFTINGYRKCGQAILDEVESDKKKESSKLIKF